MDVREKLVEIMEDLGCNDEYCKDCEFCNDIDGCVHRRKEIIADRLIANGVTVQEWISVEDRLPEKDGQYLIFTTQYFTPDHIDEIDHKDGIEISGYCKRYGFLSENGLHAKYWRDIPQPPKGDKHMDNYKLTPNTTTLENSYDEHIIKVEITFIGDEPKSAEEIKKLLGADHVLIKSTKVFHHKRRNRRK